MTLLLTLITTLLQHPLTETTNLKPAHNSTYNKLAVQCSADTFVVNQSLVLRINIFGENRHLRQARKRYGQCYDDCTTRQQRTEKN